MRRQDWADDLAATFLDWLKTGDTPEDIAQEIARALRAAFFKGVGSVHIDDYEEAEDDGEEGRVNRYRITLPEPTVPGLLISVEEAAQIGRVTYLEPEKEEVANESVSGGEASRQYN